MRLPEIKWVYVPNPNADKNSQLEWRAFVGNVSFEFHEGNGRLHQIIKQTGGGYPNERSVDFRATLIKSLRTGNINGFRTRPIPAPKNDDLWYCLAIDSQALYSSFDEWCGNLGYDSDSIKAFNTYNACCDNARKLIKLGIGLNELQEAYQNY